MQQYTYTQVINETLQYYLDGQLDKAYDFITEHGHKTLGNQAQIYNFRYAIASGLNKPALALEIMKEAIVDKGYWYAYDYLIEDEDLENIRDTDTFKELAARCKEREEEALTTTQGELMICLSEERKEEEPTKLLMALHGNQESSEQAYHYWKTALTGNRVLALPQSSVIEFSDAYNWEDTEKGVGELVTHYNHLVSVYNLHPDQIILSGFSAGCQIILKAILEKDVKTSGIIFVGPWLPELEEQKRLLQKLKDEDIACYVICGDADEDCYAGTKEFVQALADLEISHQYIEYAELDHDFPPNFEEELEIALQYLEK